MNKKVFVTGILVSLVSFLVLSVNLGKPFVGIHDWNGARYGNIARNYVKYGLETKLGQVEQRNPDGSFLYYTHYPPLLPMLIATSYKIFGISEGATRLVPALATSLLLTSIFLIGYFLWNYKIGLLASLLALSTPMVQYFGKNPVHELIVALFGVLAFLGLAQLLKDKKDRNALWLVFVSSVLAALSGWGGYFVAPAAVLVFWKLRFSRQIIISYIGLLAVLFVGHFVFVKFLTGSFFGGGLKEIFLYRLGQEAAGFGLIDFVSQVRLWASTLFTVSLIVASFIGLTRLKSQKDKLPALLVLGMLIFGGVYPLIFSNATFFHNYFIFGLTPVLAILSALGVDKISASAKKPFLIIAALLLLLVSLERRGFLLALEESRQDELAYTAGKRINVMSDVNDTILVLPQNYFASRWPFLFYYAERSFANPDPNFPFSLVVSFDERENSFTVDTGGSLWKYQQ